ncbi:hypothetical protein ABZ671_17500 [Micromonospora sp. NPDC006766]|uniref:hypothetical protein n=1 Tax=Micromonospora sp. NPDC006766 TaxID=3154778 RepID=UPI0033F769ED
MKNNADLTTDGWRGLPARNWSEREIVGRALGLATAIEGTIAVGYDSRAGSRDLAVLVGRALTTMGHECAIASRPTPTPAVGRYVSAHEGIAGGIIITASHNPPGDIGIKVRGGDGLPFDGDLPTAAWDIDALVASLRPGPDSVDITGHYRDTIGRSFLESANGFDGLVVFDAMYGVVGVLAELAGPVGWRRSVAAPYFLGGTPDPVLRCQAEPAMKAALLACGDPSHGIVFMTDGDGDRLCAYTKAAGYITSTELAMALIRDGLDVRTVIATQVAESALRETADRAELDYASTFVGFKNIIAHWKAVGRPAALGVEPNGGLALSQEPDSYFERDGIAGAARVLRQFRSVAELDAVIHRVRIERRFEPRQFTTTRPADSVCSTIQARWPDGTVQEMDGIARLSWPDGARVLLRQSGTEAVVRCYVEGPEEMLTWFQRAI